MAFWVVEPIANMILEQRWRTIMLLRPRDLRDFGEGFPLPPQLGKLKPKRRRGSDTSADFEDELVDDGRNQISRALGDTASLVRQLADDQRQRPDGGGAQWQQRLEVCSDVVKRLDHWRQVFDPAWRTNALTEGFGYFECRRNKYSSFQLRQR